MTITPHAVAGREPRRERAPSRTRLVRLVLEGYLYLTAVIGTFVVAAAFLAWGLVNRRPLIGLIAVLVGVPVLVTATRAIRALFFTRSRPEGVLLTRGLGSGVLAAVEEIRSRVHAPKVHEVLITDQFNAAVVQIARAGLFWPRNTLLLGYPMIATLSDAHIRAVIAHELGHLTQGHGRLAAWVHRTRLSWLRLMNDLGARGATPAHAHLLFRWYVPRLDVEAAAVSRQQERLADRLAADVAGFDTAAETLIAMEIGASVFDRDFWPGIFNRVVNEAAPPSPFAEMGPHIWAAAAGRARLLTELLDRPTASDDTHPSLRERLDRLGGVARLPSPVVAPAAGHLLGDCQRQIASILDRQWQSAHAVSWQEQHEELRRARERLARLAATDSPTPEQRYEHGELLERDGRVEEALERYQSANAAGHLAAGLAAGRILLERHDAAGVTLIEAAMDAQPSLVDEGCQNVIAFLESRGQHAAAQRFHVRQTREATLARMAAAERERLTVVDRFEPCSDARVDRSSVARRLAAEPIVSRAFLVAKALRHSSGAQTVLVLVANGAVRELVGSLKREGIVPEHVEIVPLDSRAHQLHAALEQTPGALFYERTG